jgi:outer membrane protein assembly factor BamA
MDATTGSFIKASISPSAGIGGGFMKAGLSASKFKSFGKNKNFTLALNAQAGTSVGGLPQFAQYRLGGWNGVRGFRSFSDLGTGAGMLMGTAELRAKLAFLPDDNKITSAIKKNVKIAGFLDYGQVVGNSTTNSLLSRSNFGASVGLGLRINMPMVGLVRIDYGLPIVSTILGNRTPRMTVGFGEKF